MERVKLQAHDFELVLAPDAGGAIASLRWRGLPLLRDGLEPGLSAGDPLCAASFPMVPYAGRIVDGALQWGTVVAAIPKNMDGADHPLHGNGWRTSWRVSKQDDTMIQLRFDHGGDQNWPWALEATQDFVLNQDHCDVTLRVTSKDPRPFPATLGPHPYFPAKDAVVRFAVDALWETSGDALPVGLARPDVVDQLDKGVRAETLRLDHCFEGWKGAATIAWPTHSVAMIADCALNGVQQACTRIQLYTPEGQDFFCLEPVSARPAGFSDPDWAGLGIVELQENDTLSITTRLTPSI